MTLFLPKQFPVQFVMPVATKARLGPATPMDVIAEITQAAGEGASMYARRQRTGVFRTIRMPVFDRFVPARQEPLRVGYLLPPQHRGIVTLLRSHGVRVEQLTGEWRGSAEAFRVDSVTVAPNLFEGHRTVTAEGNWAARDASAAAGWYFVSTRQRLGVLAAYLLEPESDDGVVTWNLMDRDLRRNAEYPFLRATAQVNVPRRVVE